METDNQPCGNENAAVTPPTPPTDSRSPVLIMSEPEDPGPNDALGLPPVVTPFDVMEREDAVENASANDPFDLAQAATSPQAMGSGDLGSNDRPNDPVATFTVPTTHESVLPENLVTNEPPNNSVVARSPVLTTDALEGTGIEDPVANYPLKDSVVLLQDPTPGQGMLPEDPVMTTSTQSRGPSLLRDATKSEDLDDKHRGGSSSLEQQSLAACLAVACANMDRKLSEMEQDAVGQANGEAAGDGNDNGGDPSSPGTHEVAVAVAVDENYEDSIVVAIEYDPEEKPPPMLKNRRFQLYMCAGSCVLAIAIIAAVLATEITTPTMTMRPPFNPNMPPTLSPTLEMESLVRSTFSLTVGDRPSDPNSPSALAMEWMLQKDPMKLDLEAENYLQRYLLVLFYFQTSNSGNEPWRSCNPAQEGEDSTCTFLQFVRGDDDSVRYVPVPNSIRWLSGQSECDWAGVQCEGGNDVLGLELFGQKLSGPVPTELAALTLLQKISLPYNEFVGTIPTELAYVRYLHALELHGNSLTGDIPTQFFDSEANMLKLFNVGENLLSGKLPSTIANLRDLVGLHVFENNLSGEFPSEIGRLNYLVFLRANNNQFSGELSTTLGRLRQLNELWLFQNFFTGTIPTELGNLQRLKDIRLHKNSRLTGSIPDELWNLQQLTFFYLHELNLSGTLSTEVGLLSNLIAFRVSKNQLVGTIPTEMGNLTNLQLVWIHLNQFQGTIPDGLCDIAMDENLYVFQADCFPVNNPQVDCPCCSSCCNSATAFCDYVR